LTDELPVKRTPKRKLQKLSLVISRLSTFVAIVFGIYLFTIIESENMVIKASIGATTFFFFMVGLVLNTIATSDLPNLKVDK